FISRFIALGPQDAILNVLVAYGLTFCLMSVSGFITGVFGLVLVSLLPFVPVLLLSHDPASGLSINDGKTMTKEEKAEIKPLVIKLLLAVAVFGIFMGAMKGLFTGARGGWTSMMSLVMVASTLLTAGLIVLSGKLSRRLDAVVVYRCVFFVAVVCVAGLTIDAAHSREMYVGSRVCGELFRCLIVVFSLRLCQRTSFHPLMVAGSLLALAKIASLASGIVVNAIPDSFGAITQGMGLLVVLAFLYLYLFTETDVDALMETSHVTSTREANKQRCEALAARAGLSGREAEVLELYSQGKTVAVIAETLHLSENTVSMYRRKIYAKLDIHSKQELLELLEKEEQ
ncbi:MAG: helix-turn-helix transcriptional regulator, partial [Coriobacteriales bacterium]|nr:helix-turn-helix transcriptional regulator [Coriobacteriales bacterium]